MQAPPPSQKMSASEYICAFMHASEPSHRRVPAIDTWLSPQLSRPLQRRSSVPPGIDSDLQLSAPSQFTPAAPRTVTLVHEASPAQSSSAAGVSTVASRHDSKPLQPSDCPRVSCAPTQAPVPPHAIEVASMVAPAQDACPLHFTSPSMVSSRHSSSASHARSVAGGSV